MPLPHPPTAALPPAEDFAAVYTSLAQSVLTAAAQRGERRINLPHATLAAVPEWAVPLADLMALPDREFVENCHFLVLDRVGWPSEVNAWVLLLKQRFLNRDLVLAQMLASREHVASGRHVVFV